MTEYTHLVTIGKFGSNGVSITRVVMDHPPDAAMHAFWQITELSDAIERRLAARTVPERAP